MNKTEFYTADLKETNRVAVSNSDLRRTKRFKYIVAILSANGELHYEIG